MTREEAVKKLARILSDHIDGSETTLEYIATQIYADVVAVAVDDEREMWIMLSARNPDLVC